MTVTDMRIYTRMRGGLGNQMFQYAFARAISLEDGPAEIKLDVREYNNYKTRKFELLDFKLADKTVVCEDEHLLYDSYISAYRVYQHMFFKLSGRRPSDGMSCLYPKGIILSGRTCSLPHINLPDNVYLYGYFQSATEILDIRNQLKSDFELRSKSNRLRRVCSEIEDSAIGVSIRYGEDYQRSKWPVQSKKYYLTALKELEAGPDRQIVIFSDCIKQIQDEKWFEEYKNLIYVTDFLPAEQIEIMRNCRDFVISNSSFAWWGGFLGVNQSGRVIAPAEWYQNGIRTKDTLLRFPELTVLE